MFNNIKLNILISGGLIVLLVSFFVTLRVLDHWDKPPDPVTLFKGVDAHTPVTFEKSASIAGFKKSNSLVGLVDSARLTPSGDLEVSGWAVDSNASGNPVYLYIFWNGRAVFAAEANGSRPDVTLAMRLSTAAAANVIIKGTSKKIVCDTRHSAMGIVVNQNYEFTIIPNLTISGCN
jgi:hypothetical protein